MKNYSHSGAAERLFSTALAVLLLMTSTGCIVAGGYSSGRGFFIWPGSIIFILIGLALFLLMFFRRRG